MNSNTGPVFCRGVRGATTAGENSAPAILEATRELLERMVRANGIRPEDIAGVMFTATKDLTAEFPSRAVRQFDWPDVALMCGREIDVPGSMPKCVRILLYWNTPKSAREIVHVYIHGAETLRPDRGE